MVIGSGITPAPAYCHECGASFPWTATRIAVAKAMADELDELDDAQRIQLKASIDDIAGDTPRTELAVMRAKKLIAKVPSALGDTVRKILVDVASEAALKMMKTP